MDGIRVLVAEDDEKLRATLVELLRLEGHVVEAVENGAQALDSLLQAPPAVVLLDINMPVLDGFGFAQEVEARGINVPIVVMTGGIGARQTGTGIRANAWLEKPFRMSALLPAIKHAWASPP